MDFMHYIKSESFTRSYETYPDADHHIQMTLTVLLDYISDVVRLSGLLKFPTSYEVFDLPDCTNCILMDVS